MCVRESLNVRKILTDGEAVKKLVLFKPFPRFTSLFSLRERKRDRERQTDRDTGRPREFV